MPALMFSWPMHSHPHFNNVYEWQLANVTTGAVDDEGQTEDTTIVIEVPEPTARTGYQVEVGWVHGRSGKLNHHFTTVAQFVEPLLPEEPEPMPGPEPDPELEPEPEPEPEEPEPEEPEPEPPIVVEPPDEEGPEPPVDPSDRHPHEPDWANRVFFDHGEWNGWPHARQDVDGGGFAAAKVGHVQFAGLNATDHQFGITLDPSAPAGYAGYVRALYNAGRRVGTGAWNWTARGGSGDPWPFAMKRWYVSFWSFLEPEPDGQWETNFDQFRMFTLNRHVSATLFGFTYRGVLRYSGTSVRWEHGEPQRMQELRAYRYWGYRCDGCSSDTFASSTPGMPLGQWVHHELIFDRTVKTSGPLFAKGADGIGPVHVIHRANGKVQLDRVLENVYMEAPMAELHVNFNQSGGISPTVDRRIRFTGMYISGERV